MNIKFVAAPMPLDDVKIVRQKVFQEEQGISSELDFDGKDESAIHVVCYLDKKPVGTGRIRMLNEKKAKIERVCVLVEHRRKGIGRSIMLAIDKYLKTSDVVESTLDAQNHAKHFYESLGYKVEGDIFEEVGISHVVMVKSHE